MHLALAEYFRRKIDPVALFKQEWSALREVELRYSRKDSWQSLNDKGEKLLQKSCREEVQKITRVLSVESVLEIGVSNRTLPFVYIGSARLSNAPGGSNCRGIVSPSLLLERLKWQ